MYTASTVAPALCRGVALDRRAHRATPIAVPDPRARHRRWRLLQELAGPAKTPVPHRPRRTARRDRSTGPASRADQQCPSP